MGLANSTTEAYSPDSFVQGGELVTDHETISTGQTIAKYSPLGRVTASGEVIESLPGASDGSQVPIGIAVHDIDTTAGAADHPVYKGGVFNADLVAWDASWTAAQKAGAFDGTPVVLTSPE
ncbi:MAG: hypothetical protein Hals2KO_21570 [Halioglobus sp.]